MGTRHLTRVFDEQGRELVCLYAEFAAKYAPKGEVTP